MIKLLSLFSGIGAFEKTLDRLKVEYELVNYCEIDKYASKSYSAVHNIPETLNLWDVTKVDTSKLPKNIDLITYGFPCQDISTAGKTKGLFNEDGTLTRSGLFFEALRIIEDVKPKVAIAENVKNLTSKRFSKQFKIVLESLKSAGYNNYWKILNSRDYGIPQKRERVFIVSIRKDLDKGAFKFPEAFELKLRLKDLLEEEVNEKYYVKDEIKQVLLSVGEKSVKVKEATKKGYVEAYEGDSININYANSKTRRGRVGKNGVANTLTCSDEQVVVVGNNLPTDSQITISGALKLTPKVTDVANSITARYHKGFSNYNPENAVVETKWNKNKNVHLSTYVNKALETNAQLPCAIDEQNVTIVSDGLVGTITTDGSSPKHNNRVLQEDLRVRRLTPLECWRLMGFDDEDFYKAEKVNSNTQLYKQAGNSIVVDVLEYLFKEILEAINMKKVEEVKTITYECDDLINVALLKEKEPELYAELLADYPAETATYVFKNRTA